MKHSRYTPMLVVMMALISFMCLSLGVSYSYVMRSKVSGNAMIITTGNLTSSVDYTSASYILSAMTDEEGLAQEDYGVITITKNNVYSVFYTMNISYAVNSIPQDNTVGDLMPMEYIKVALYPMSGTTLASTPVVGPVSISDLTMASVSADSVFRDTYLLNYETFNSGSQNAKYAIKVWLDKDTPAKYDEYLIYLGINVDQETLVSKSLYNLSGTVVNSSGTAVNGAKVSFHNGKITSTTSSGAYSLANVPTGTYNLSVVYNGVEYKTTMHIKGGSAVSLASTGTQTGAAGTYLQNSAYTYYTSPGSILKANSLTTSSNQLSTATYTIPNAYVLTGVESLSVLPISNLKLTLNADNTLGVSIAS